MSRARYSPEDHAARRAWIADLPPKLAALYDGPSSVTGRPPIPLGDRIRSGIEVAASGCWIWQRKLDRDGYGSMTIGGGPHRCQHVHRVVYIWLVGDLADDLTLDHLCRVRACCNPEHLEPVPNAVNILRGDGPFAINARKTQCNRGHDLVGPNLVFVATRGRIYRGCRECRNETSRRWWAANRGS